MDKLFQSPRSHLFTVRVWEESIGDGQIELRGKVQLVTNGDVHYFREWESLVPLLKNMLTGFNLQPEVIPEAQTDEEQ